MKRREFLIAGVAGLAGVSSLSKSTVVANEKAPEGAVVNIDPDKLARAAVHQFLPGKRTCGESVLMAGCQTLGIQGDLIPDIALGLAGGIGLSGKTCGTITASAMVLGLAVAAEENDSQKKFQRTMAAVGGLCEQFEREFKTTECRQLCGLDLTTLEGRKALKEGVKANTCAKYVEACARMLAKSISTI